MPETRLFPLRYSVNSNPLFPNLNITEGIDLREEMSRILHGWGNESGKGHWVVYRRFDLSQPTNRDTDASTIGEAVGGPAWEFTDELYLTRRVVMQAGGALQAQEQPTTPGILSIPFIVYYFEHNVNPKAEDEIYEIYYQGKEEPITIQPPYRERHQINMVVPYRCDDWGRVEYYSCRVKGDPVRW